MSGPHADAHHRDSVASDIVTFHTAADVGREHAASPSTDMTSPTAPLESYDPNNRGPSSSFMDKPRDGDGPSSASNKDLEMTGIGEDTTQQRRPSASASHKGFIGDEEILSRLGYKQELYRGFSGFMAFSFCMTSVAVISSLSTSYGLALDQGGPPVLAYGWLIVSFFTILVGLAMGELASAYPTAGSVYHWAHQLSNRSQSHVWCYICGWFNFLGNSTGDAAFAFAFASILAGTVELASGWSNNDLFNNNGMNTVWTSGTIVGVGIGISAAWMFKNLLRVDHQGWFNNLASIYQMITTAVILITLLSAASLRSSRNFVWHETQDGTSYPGGAPLGYLVFTGLISALFSFSGYEAGAHMGEETRQAHKTAPFSIIGTTFATAIVGFTYIMALLYVSLDYTLVTAGPTSSPVVNAFAFAFSQFDGNSVDDINANLANSNNPNFITYINISGALAMCVLLLIDLFFAGFSSMTVTSRIAFAMARDGALPFSKYIYALTPKFNKAPMGAVILTFILDVLFVCFLLFDSGGVAFTAITSITVIGYQISYAIPIMLRLTASRHTFRKNIFHLGNYSEVVGWIAVIWLVCTSIIMFWPNYWTETDGTRDTYGWVDLMQNVTIYQNQTVTQNVSVNGTWVLQNITQLVPINTTTEPVTWMNGSVAVNNLTWGVNGNETYVISAVVDKDSMNYTVVVVGGVLFIAFIWWWFPVVGARRTFTGPRRIDDGHDISKSAHGDDGFVLNDTKPVEPLEEEKALDQVKHTTAE